MITPIKTVEQERPWLWFAYAICIVLTAFISHLIAQVKA